MPKFASVVNSLRSSEIRDLMNIATRPGIISFAGGMPDNDLFPVDDIDNIYNSLTLKEKQLGMHYVPTGGLPRLLESLADYLKKRGLPVEQNKILITTGSLQAINILAKTFTDPGDRILVEDPCFVGGISVFKSYQAEMTGIPLTEDGISLELLKKNIEAEKRPKFLYITPNFHNPAGILYKKHVKEELISLMKGTDIPVIEDDAYSAIYFYEEDKIHLKTIKEINPEGIDVCYTGSFSKILGPGLRLGWMLVPEHIYNKCEVIKQSLDACSPSFTQVIADKFIRTGAVYNYIENVRQEYRKRAAAMTDAMKQHFPAYTSWNNPRGGFYIWVNLPEGTDSTEILKSAAAKGAVFVSGKTFDPEGIKNNAMRISFCNTSVEKINSGIPIVADAIRGICG